MYNIVIRTSVLVLEQNKKHPWELRIMYVQKHTENIIWNTSRISCILIVITCMNYPNRSYQVFILRPRGECFIKLMLSELLIMKWDCGCTCVYVYSFIHSPWPIIITINNVILVVTVIASQSTRENVYESSMVDRIPEYKTSGLFKISSCLDR